MCEAQGKSDVQRSRQGRSLLVKLIDGNGGLPAWLMT